MRRRRRRLRHVVVYTESTLVEQTTPDAFQISDAASTVSWSDEFFGVLCDDGNMAMLLLGNCMIF